MGGNAARGCSGRLGAATGVACCAGIGTGAGAAEGGESTGDCCKGGLAAGGDACWFTAVFDHTICVDCVCRPAQGSAYQTRHCITDMCFACIRCKRSYWLQV